MIGVFIDTIVICTMTALVILTVTGDYKKNPALMAANQCAASQAGIELPLDPTQGAGARYSIETLFPTAYDEEREAKIAAVGPPAQSYLLACQAGGVEVSQQALDAAGNPGVLMDVDHAWQTDANSSAITTRAYGEALPYGEFIVAIALLFFAFTTILGWSYYGEQAVTYLLGEWATHPFRYIWVLVVFAGTVLPATQLWLLGDIANASMAFPNLIAILALSGVVISMHKLGDDPDHAHPVHDYSQHDKTPGE